MNITMREDGLFNLTASKDEIEIFAEGVQQKLESLEQDIYEDPDAGLGEIAGSMTNAEHWWSVYNALRSMSHMAEEQE
ncbi:MAG: hypothetical protein LC650_05520 [Actinobacteria bacterium]|nr:hypothetical protein [Actinomycetota bacterium]